MPNVTVYGVGGSIVSIPLTSASAASVAQTALNSVSALIAANEVTPFNANGTFPTASGPIELVYTSGSPAADTISAASPSVVSLVDNETAPLSILMSQSYAQTVVAGAGGLTFTQAAASVTGSLIVAGGGTTVINLAAGANTVNADPTPAGATTVNAAAGGAVVSVNGVTNGVALVFAGKNDTLQLAGTVAVGLNDSTSTISVAPGGAAFFANASSTQGASRVALASGNETVGVYSGSVESIIGGGAGTVFAAAGAGVAGSMIIDPNQQAFVLFAGSGSATLFGSGDIAGLAATGTDIVLGGTGYFHAGSGGGSLLESAASISGPATTLVGGGSGDALFAQSTNVSLLGSAGTSILDAAGMTVGGGVARFGAVTTSANPGTVLSVLGASGGDTLNAGASNAVIFGALSGANTIISGTGSSTVFGHSGVTSGSGNVYLDGGVGKMTITDFMSSDTFKLTNGTTVANVTPTSGGTGSTVTLSDGTTVTLLGLSLTSSNVGTYFHS